jgi:hypothetical protein
MRTTESSFGKMPTTRQPPIQHLVEALERVRRLVLAPVSLREVREGEHLDLRVTHQLGGLFEALGQHLSLLVVLG